MALNRPRVVDNSRNYSWDESTQKFTCNYCSKTFAKTSLNVNTKAAHLSSVEFAKKYKIAICKYAPIALIEENVEYLSRNYGSLNSLGFSEFWDDNHFAMPNVMAAFRSALDKIFYHHGESTEECIQKAFSEFTEYKDKKGQFADRTLYKLSKNCEPGNFWRVHCSFAPHLRYASVRMLEQKEGASACERNWKEFKWVRSDLRAQLGIEKAVKLVSIHSTSLLLERDEQNYSIEYKKFTDDDELCRLDLGLEAAQTTTLPFNNFLEDWESVAIFTMNDVNLEKLKAKYMHIHFYDADADKDHNSEVYRVVDVEWHEVKSSAERKAGKRSQNQVVAVCIERNGETVQESSGDKVYIGYVINKMLHSMIRDCPEPYNDAFKLLLEYIDE
jgi:hypothetical protein